jgi:branched-chain amino acid aminotransferase
MTANGEHIKASTPPATSAVDWHSVGFKVREVNGHAQATWKDGKWSSAEFVRDPVLAIHGFASCLNYGQVTTTILVSVLFA